MTGCHGTAHAYPSSSMISATRRSPVARHPMNSMTSSHMPSITTTSIPPACTSRACRAAGSACGEYLAAYGDEQVAAAVPIAGEGRPAWATSGCALGEVAIWAIHGELDDVVNPAGQHRHDHLAERMPRASRPDRARLSIYPDLYHDGWDQAYSGSEGDDIYSWMLSFTHNSGSTRRVRGAPRVLLRALASTHQDGPRQGRLADVDQSGIRTA